jgi:hypothetical protein
MSRVRLLGVAAPGPAPGVIGRVGAVDASRRRRLRILFWRRLAARRPRRTVCRGRHDREDVMYARTDADEGAVHVPGHTSSGARA